MKYQLSGIIDAELKTLGQVNPESIKSVVDGARKDLVDGMKKEPVYVINGTERFYFHCFIGPYLRPADTPVDRMRIELDDLAEKLVKLDIFLGTPKFLSLDKEMCDLLHSQYKVMKEYKEILEKRLELMQNQ